MTTQKALTPIEEFRGTIQRMAPEFAAALPPQIPAEKFTRTTITAVQMQPDLLQCDRRSLIGACMKAAQDGLLPDGREAALVIFRGKGGALAQYMPMIGGVLKKVRQSGELESIDAQLVRENDTFQYRPGTDLVPQHDPDWFGDRGEVIGVYAVAKTKDGGHYVEIMNRDEIEKVRAVSRAKYGPWVDWWEEMARKTVLRRLAKRLPSSADVDQMWLHDTEAAGIEHRREVSVTPTKAPLSRLKASMSDVLEDQAPEALTEEEMAQIEAEEGDQ